MESKLIVIFRGSANFLISSEISNLMDHQTSDPIESHGNVDFYNTAH